VARIKPKYNPTPTAREKAFHLWLMENFLCSCGCGGFSEVVHHVLGKHPLKRWRRDHEMVVPMRAVCHMALHGAGSEAAFDPATDYPAQAAYCRQVAMEAGKL
jgi:hypothetical protein